MASYKDVRLGSVGDTAITLDDLVFQLKTTLKQTIIDDTVQSILIRRAAANLAVSVSDAELQQAADSFRERLGLVSAQETKEWMAERGLTLDEFERKIEQDLLRKKVQEKVATEDKITKVFAENMLQFESANAAIIVVEKQGLANEIKSQLQEGEVDFAALAAKHSVDTASAGKGGYLGYIHRKELPDAVDVAVFAQNAPDLVGPVAAEGRHYIVKILGRRKADPKDEATRSTCAQMILDDYLAEKGDTMKVKLDFIPQSA